MQFIQRHPSIWLLVAALLVGIHPFGRGQDDPSPPLVKAHLPSSSVQEDLLRQVRQRFKGRYPPKTVSDAKGLLWELIESSRDLNDPVERFVYLREARDLAAKVGDAAAVLFTVDEIAERFEVNALAMKAAGLAAAAGSAPTREEAAAVARRMFEVLAGLLAAGDFEGARELAKKAVAPARKSQDPRLLARAQAWARETSSLESDYKKASECEKKLLTAPDDPGANLELGKYLCFIKDDWDGGLAKLARSRGPLRDLAARTLARPTEPGAQAAIAEGLKDLGLKEDGPWARRHIFIRSIGWYRQAIPGLAGLERDKAESSIKSLQREILPDELCLILGKKHGSSGMTLRPGRDGPSQAMFYQGRPCARLMPGQTPDRIRYLYFGVVDEEWCSANQAIEVEIELFDGPAGPCQVQYNSINENYKTAARNISTGSTRAWKVQKVTLPDARFRKRQNGQSDLRIQREPAADLYVHRITLRPAEPVADASVEKGGPTHRSRRPSDRQEVGD